MRGRERENIERERHCNNKKRVFLFFSFLLLRVSPVITHTKKRGEIKATVGVEENKKGLKMTLPLSFLSTAFLFFFVVLSRAEERKSKGKNPLPFNLAPLSSRKTLSPATPGVRLSPPNSHRRFCLPPSIPHHLITDLERSMQKKKKNVALLF